MELHLACRSDFFVYLPNAATFVPYKLESDTFILGLFFSSLCRLLLYLFVHLTTQHLAYFTFAYFVRIV